MTLVEAGPRLLSREEPFAGDEIAAALRVEGLTVMTGAAITSVHRAADGSVVASVPGRTITADELLVATGRRPATNDIGLDTVGLEPGAFVSVDSGLRAAGVPGGWLYAVGDVNGSALLTHMGKYQGRRAGDVILGRIPGDEPLPAVPRVTFTDPQVAAVGLTEREARERGLTIRVVAVPTGGVAGAYTQGVGITGTSQLVVDESRGVVVGATFTGANVQEMLHAATIAIVAAVPLDRLWHAVPAFPTVSEVWLRLLEAYGL